MSTVSERSWNSSDDYEDENSTNRSSVTRRISFDLDLPGGVITTHCVSTVIRPGSKQTHDPLQFVKIQSTELSKKAVEQIRLAEEVKITKEKIKEVEEEWQNNLLNWKSKRRQSRLTGGEESDSSENQQRKIKTFSEILNEKAKSGHRIGYNLHKYIGIQDEEEDESLVLTNNSNNNNLNNNHKEDKGSSRVPSEKNDLGDYQEDDESNQLKSYEQQQAELQKKRQELNNKLQELEQLEKKQKELERQERVNSETVSELISSPSPSSSSSPETTPTSNINSPTVIVSIKNEESSLNPKTGNVSASKSDAIKQRKDDGFREKKIFNRNSSIDLSRRDDSSESTVNDTNRQKSVWNYLLQHQEDPRVVNHNHLSNQKANPNQYHHSSRPNSQFLSIDSESEDDDHLNDSMDADEDAEKEQMLSFRAKLSTFESLSKNDPSAQQQPQQQQPQQQQQQQSSCKPIRKSEKVKKTADQLTSRLFPSASTTSPSHDSSLPTSASATITSTLATSVGSAIPVTNQNLKESDASNTTIKYNRPPTAEDLAHKEEMKVYQQRLQNHNLVEQSKHHLLYGSQLPLPANSINSQQQQQQQQNSVHHLHHYHLQQPNHQKQSSLDKPSWTSSNSPSHLPTHVQGSQSYLNQLSKPYTHPGQQALHHPHHQQHLHHHSRTSSEETRESTNSNWEASNFVCDKEVEKISESMNKGNLISDDYRSVGNHETGTPTTNSNLHPLSTSSSSISINQQIYNQTSQLIHPHHLIQQQQQQLVAQHQLKMNRHSVPNLVRGYDQQQYYLMNEVMTNDDQQSMASNNHVNNINNSMNSKLKANGNSVHKVEDNYYSNQEQIDLIKKQMMPSKQINSNSYLNEAPSSLYLHHASKSQSNLNGIQMNNLSGQQLHQQQHQQPSELASTTYHPIHQQRAVNQSLLRYHHYQGSIQGLVDPSTISQHQHQQFQQQTLTSLPATGHSHQQPSTTASSVAATSTSAVTTATTTIPIGLKQQQQQLHGDQLYSNYYGAHQMGKSQSTPNMSYPLTTQPAAPPPPSQSQPQQSSPYNINHWVIQEAELRRLHYTQHQPGPALMARSAAINKFPQSSQLNLNNSINNTYENHVYENSPFRGSITAGLNRIQNLPVTGGDATLMKKSNGLHGIQQVTIQQPQQSQQQSIQATNQQSQGPLQLAQPLQPQQQQSQQLQQKQMLSVSGKKKCSSCGDELGRGCAAMVIETLALYYHINCFRCSVCHIQLGNGTCGTDVRVRNHKLHCHNCYSNDEAGLKFSRV